MTFSPRTTREVRRLALDVVLLDGEQDAAPSLADMARRAKALLDGPLREKRSGIPKPSAPGRTRADEKAAAKERLERLATIRVELHTETGGTCAVCGMGLPFTRMHAHHILSGPERRSEERRETMAPVHEKCHDWLHGKLPKHDQWDALWNLLGWCDQTGREEAAKSIRHRLSKIKEARATVPVRIVVKEGTP